jgi:hypothetical protein
MSMSISDLIKTDKERMQILFYVKELGLPDCWVAAGFVRNMIWDCLHGIPSTPLNDIDVIFFDRSDVENRMVKWAQTLLHRRDPNINWEIKNQAFMHLKNEDPPYGSSMDAMSYWPEIETAVGVRLNSNDEVEVCAPFGVDSLMQGKVTPNPKRSLTLARQRSVTKGWLQQWQGLKFEPQYFYSRSEACRQKE